MEELARYQEGYARIVVSRDGDQLIFWSDFDDNGRSIISESRIATADYLAKGEGPWPWYDLGERRAGALQVFDALGMSPAVWTNPLAPHALELFHAARNGWASVADRLTPGLGPDVLDACGASPLWYAVRALDPLGAPVLIDAGADAGRRIELSARGELFTTILHEIVRCGRTVALTHALARGVDPALRDSDGVTPLHCLDDRSDHVNPEMVRALVAAGADVDAATSSGRRPIDTAAQRLLPASVATMLDLGAETGTAVTAVLVWWAANARWVGYRAREVVNVIEVLRAAGATVASGDHELATAAGDLAVIAALG